MAANEGGRKGQDEALAVERSVARDSLSEWQLSKEGVASSGRHMRGAAGALDPEVEAEAESRVGAGSR
ncbi:hypothetical protein IMZ48_42320 [Candidatus Bathyarchaeota archaeon]|nr:hypothetical protein [Candidatus Bathyarchaeota archaeon]